MRRLVALPVPLLLALGCASTPVAPPEPGGARQDAGPGRRVEFPDREALDALARRPAPAEIFPGGERDLNAPDDLAAAARPVAEPAGAWDRLLADELARAGGDVRATEPMRCLAREVGRFTVATLHRPDALATSVMAARCGVSDGGVGMAYVVQPLQGGERDAELRDRMGPAMRSLIHSALGSAPPPGAPRTAGMWFGRGAARAVAMLVHAQPLARLDAYPARPDANGRVRVSGEVLRPAARVDGLVTRGRHGFATCAADGQVALPRFALRCEVDPADDEAVLEIAAFGDRRIYGPVVASARLWPRGEPPRARPRRPATTETPGDLAGALVAEVNRVRSEAGLAPVDLAPDQSRTAAALAPHFFAAETRSDLDEQETIVLGLRAGWQVPGLVRAGHFTAARVEEAAGAGGLVAVALDRPSGREALLSPDTRAMAVGVVRARGGVGAVFATYALVDPAHAAEEADAVVRRLDAERARRGHPATRPFREAERPLGEIAASVERGDADGRRLAQEVLAAAKRSASGGGMIYSWVGYAETLDRLELPTNLLEVPDLRVAVAVAHCKLRGRPWTTYCVLVTALQKMGTG